MARSASFLAPRMSLPPKGIEDKTHPKNLPANPESGPSLANRMCSPGSGFLGNRYSFANRESLGAGRGGAKRKTQRKARGAADLQGEAQRQRWAEERGCLRDKVAQAGTDTAGRHGRGRKEGKEDTPSPLSLFSHMHTYTYTRAHGLPQIRTDTRARTCLRIRTCTHARTHIHTHAHTRIYKSTRAHTHIHAHTYIRTHTNIARARTRLEPFSLCKSRGQLGFPTAQLWRLLTFGRSVKAVPPNRRTFGALRSGGRTAREDSQSCSPSKSKATPQLA